MSDFTQFDHDDHLDDAALMALDMGFEIGTLCKALQLALRSAEFPCTCDSHRECLRCQAEEIMARRNGRNQKFAALVEEPVDVDALPF